MVRPPHPKAPTLGRDGRRATRCCIVTGGYYKARETQINTHVERLFGGETCVISVSPGAADPLGKAVFQRPGGRGPLETLARPVTRAISSVRYGTVKVPMAAERQRIAAFLRDQGVTVGLSEFADLAMDHAPVFRAAGIPFFAYLRGKDVTSALARPRRLKAYRRMMGDLAGVIGVCDHLVAQLAEAGVRHPNSHVIPSGVDTAQFTPRPKLPKRCIAVGRFVEKKLPLLTIRAFADAGRDHPDAVLEMIGEGPLLAASQALAAELGLGGRVIFHGLLPHDAVRERLGRAQIFLQHSVTAPNGDTEGLPTSIQEAMAAGLAVISTRHAGIPEAVTEGETGLLVDEYDALAFTAQISAALNGQYDLSRMGQAARQTALTRFDKTRLFAQLEAVLVQGL